MIISPSPLRDILLIDLETSGTDPQRHGIVQLAAIRLDQVELIEHSHYVSYVRMDDEDEFDPEAGSINKIDELAGRSQFTPSLSTVLGELQTFAHPSEVILSAWNGAFDLGFLLRAYQRTGRPWLWDFHMLEIWSLAWLLFPDMTSPNLVKICERLDVPYKPHEALSDVRMEAEILRKMVELARERRS